MRKEPEILSVPQKVGLNASLWNCVGSQALEIKPSARGSSGCISDFNQNQTLGKVETDKK